MKKAVTAYQKFIRQSPRKVRLIADLVRGLSVSKALDQLSLTNKRAAGAVAKVLNQAKFNAINNSELIENTLKVDDIQIQEGPTYKRWQPVSRGRAHPILKRSSHIKIIVKGEEQTTATKTA
jgi:large subunit ribosomal protein L22